MPIFAAAATTHEQSLGVCMTIYDTEGPISGPGTSANISMRKHMSLIGVVSLVCKVTCKQWHIEETYVELADPACSVGQLALSTCTLRTCDTPLSLSRVVVSTIGNATGTVSINDTRPHDMSLACL